MSKQSIKEYVQKYAGDLEKMALDIWARPEAGFRETFASTTQKDFLEGLGAKIVAPIDLVETAFYAEYGSGKPIIGILGEFDSLPGLSQEAGKTYRAPVVEGGYGHACGHNLLGTAGVLAFASVVEAMKAEKLEGTVRYYGCPAEESYSGKSYMARAGVFNDLDCCLSWHPGGWDAVDQGSCNGFELMEFFFTGVEAHAGGAPWMGRSALDAVELMNVGANYLREHVIDAARIHYIITNGGLAVNIVPGKASVRYAVRAPKMDQIKEIVERLIDIAKGAALMTGTQMEYQVQSIYHNVMPNYTLSKILMENYEKVTPSAYTQEELDFAKAMNDTFPEGTLEAMAEKKGIDPKEMPYGFYPHAILDGDKSVCSGGSTDVGDVSYLTPTAQINAACAPAVVSAHTWQAAACYGTGFATKGMIRAGEVLAASVYDLFTDKKDQIEVAKAELKKDLGKSSYTTIPADMKPCIVD